ncbi:MAG TPA: GTP cyclohydrolase II RibA [Methylocystis sp.]|nr:GTP cyclohydrolase II RibA [Methylocystis sp.]
MELEPPVTPIKPKKRFAAFPGQVDVERAMAEIRAGRPVTVHDGPSRIVVVGVEAIDETMAEELQFAGQGSGQLVLTAARLRRLGLDRGEPGFIALPKLDVRRIHALALGVNAFVDAPVADLPPLFSGALELLRLALVLPAAIVLSAPGAETLLPGLLSVSLGNLRRFRAARSSTLRIVSRAPTPLEGAPDTEFVVFRGGEGLHDQVAVVVGKPDVSQPVTVRLHSACLTGDLFGSLKCDCGDQLRRAVRHMAENGGGVLLYLDQEGRGNGLSNKIRAYGLQAKGYDTFEADELLGFEHDQRAFDFAAEMLAQLGVARVRVMTNNPAKIAALSDAGLEIVSDHRLLGRKNDYNSRYLAAKRDRAGHLLELEA